MDFLEAARLNSERRPLRFAEGLAQRALYMLECRDMGDHDDRDAGVYFTFCHSDEELAKVIREMPDDDQWNRILGIFDLTRPLVEQGLGVPRQDWLEGGRL